MNRTLHAPLSQLLLYGLGSVAGNAVNLLLLPVISRRLPPDDYGIFSMALVLFTLFGMVLDMGVLQGLVKSYTESRNDGAQRRVFTTALTSLTVTSTLLCLPALLFAPTLAKIVFGSPAYAPHVIAVTAGAWASVFFQLILTYNRCVFSPIKHGAISLLRAIIFGAFTLLLLARMENGLTALFAGWLLPYALVVLCLLPFLVVRKLGRPSLPAARMLYSYGLPIVPSFLVLWVLTHTDLYLLRRLSSMESVGYYTLAGQLCYLMTPVNAALQMGWLPYVLRTAAHSPEDAPERIGRLWNVVFAAIGILAVAVAAFAPELVRVLAVPSYGPAAAAVPLLCLSTLLYTCFLIFSAGIHIDGSTWRLPVITAAGAAVNITLNLAVIPRWGITGAAGATVVSNAVMAGWTAFMAKRRYPIVYWNRLSMTTAGVLAVTAAVVLLLPAMTATGIAAKIAVLGIAVTILIKAGVAGRGLRAHTAAMFREMLR